VFFRDFAGTDKFAYGLLALDYLIRRAGYAAAAVFYYILDYLIFQFSNRSRQSLHEFVFHANPTLRYIEHKTFTVRDQRRIVIVLEPPAHAVHAGIDRNTLLLYKGFQIHTRLPIYRNRGFC
jgi:hypothetical protein